MDQLEMIQRQRKDAADLLWRQQQRAQGLREAIAEYERRIADDTAGRDAAVLDLAKADTDVARTLALLPKYDELLQAISDFDGSQKAGPEPASEQPEDMVAQARLPLEESDSVHGLFKVANMSVDRADTILVMILRQQGVFTIEHVVEEARMHQEFIDRRQVGNVLKALRRRGLVTKTEETVLIGGAATRQRRHYVNDVLGVRRCHSEFDGLIHGLLTRVMGSLSVMPAQDIYEVLRLRPLYVRDSAKTSEYVRTLIMKDAAVMAAEFGLCVHRPTAADAYVTRISFTEPDLPAPQDGVSLGV